MSMSLTRNDVIRRRILIDDEVYFVSTWQSGEVTLLKYDETGKFTSIQLLESIFISMLNEQKVLVEANPGDFDEKEPKTALERATYNRQYADVWLELYAACLGGIATDTEAPERSWPIDKRAAWAGNIADAGLEEYKKRFAI